MRGLSGTAWRRRYLAAVALLVLGAVVFVVANASADAGNPITGTIGGSVVVNAPGTNGSPANCTLDGPTYCTVTVYVHGQWNWYSHNKDCNVDRAGAGVGIIWNDPTEPGFTVHQGAISQQVGIASLRAGDTTNHLDQMVHPADLGNLAEGYPGASGQVFNDPAVPSNGAPTNTEMNNWKAGCGREPITATSSPGPNAPLNPSGQTCADGTLTCNGEPWGSWGYQLNGGKGYAHTYAKLSDVTSVCVNMYDVHGGNGRHNGSQVPNKLSDIIVDGNGDNSIQTNAFDPTLGKNCFSFARTSPTVVTAIHNAAHQTITSAVGGSVVHDSVTVTGANNTTPTGTVSFDWFTNGTCSGAAAANSGAVALSGSGNTATADATAFTQTPTAGSYSFLAHYSGDVNYSIKDGACEPLNVVDGKLSITPATAVNAVGTNHTLTITVAGVNGTIDAGTYTATASLVAGSVGSFVGNVNTCTYTNAAPTCKVVITSAVNGTSTVHATTTFSVGGQSITRDTSTTANTNAGGRTTPRRRGSTANIQINPATATNAVGTNHTLTISVTPLNGTIDAGTYTATASLNAGSAGSFVGGANTCTYTNAAPTCKVVITSTVNGTSTVHATTTFSVAGQQMTRATSTSVNSNAGGSNDAVKTWVDGKISINPPTATNAVGTTHTLTISVAGVNGSIDSGTYTATASLVAPVTGSFVGGANTCTYTNAAPTCKVVITSTVNGTSTVHATSTFTVAGQPSPARPAPRSTPTRAARTTPRRRGSTRTSRSRRPPRPTRSARPTR